MTEKVFYQDSYQKTLASEVVELVDDGVILAATIFYPLGGGQPGDTGRLTINGRDYPVVDTRYAPDRNNIVHFLDGDDSPIPFLLLSTDVRNALWSADQRIATIAAVCERCAKILY